MSNQQEIDDAAFRLAGRLALLIHIEDYRLGVLSTRSSRHSDHVRLERFGIDTSACVCRPEGVRVEAVRLWHATA